MNIKLYKKVDEFLFREIGLSRSSVNLAKKLSLRNKASLPISLWSYGLISTDELDQLYDFLYKAS